MPTCTGRLAAHAGRRTASAARQIVVWQAAARRACGAPFARQIALRAGVWRPLREADRCGGREELRAAGRSATAVRRQLRAAGRPATAVRSPLREENRRGRSPCGGRGEPASRGRPPCDGRGGARFARQIAVRRTWGPRFARQAALRRPVRRPPRAADRHEAAREEPASRDRSPCGGRAERASRGGCAAPASPAVRLAGPRFGGWVTSFGGHFGRRGRFRRFFCRTPAGGSNGATVFSPQVVGGGWWVGCAARAIRVRADHGRLALRVRC